MTIPDKPKSRLTDEKNIIDAEKSILLPLSIGY
jgi:hypothetical protein